MTTHISSASSSDDCKETAFVVDPRSHTQRTTGVNTRQGIEISSARRNDTLITEQEDLKRVKKSIREMAMGQFYNLAGLR